MVDSSRKDNHVVLLGCYSDPLVPRAAHVKVSGPVQYESNFFVLMNMLSEEDFQFFLVVGKFVFGNGDLYILCKLVALAC